MEKFIFLQCNITGLDRMGKKCAITVPGLQVLNAFYLFIDLKLIILARPHYNAKRWKNPDWDFSVLSFHTN